MALTPVTYPPSIISAGNPVPVAVSTSSGEYVEIEILKEVSPGGFSQVGKPLRQYPDDQGRCEWNLARTLRGYLGFAAPANIDEIFYQDEGNIRQRVWPRIREYNNLGGITDQTQTSILTAILARLEKWQGQALEEEYAAGKWLTRQPRSKFVTPNQPEWLSFIVPAGYASLTRRVIITYSDDTTNTIDSSYSGLQFGALIRMGVGHDQLSLTGSISYYTVQMVDGSGNALSTLA